MASITTVRDGNGRPTKFIVRWRTPQRKFRSRTFRRKVDAERFVTTVESSKQVGDYVDRAAGAERLSTYSARWIETRRSNDGQPLRPRTKSLYRQLLRTHIEPGLGHLRLRDITPSHVRGWHAELRGGASVAKAYRLVHGMLNTAVEDSLIARNPCVIKGAGIERSPERPLPTGDEVWRLAGAIAPRYRALVLTAGFVGLRWGELLGLQRNDIDLSLRVIHVRRSLVENDGIHQIGPPKSNAGRRSVAIPPAVAVELAQHLDLYVDAAPSAPVFIGPTGAALRRANWAPLWNTARVAVGRPDLRLHDLRHYASTLAAATGASTRELMARLGHASPAAALRYQHATAERDHILAGRMDELIRRDDTTTLNVVPLLLLPSG